MKNKPPTSHKILQANWNVSPKIKTMITTRIGGVSATPYDSFNLATHVGDIIENVNQNRQLLSKLLPDSSVTWLKQTHSHNVVQLGKDRFYNSSSECDASFTFEPRTICAVLTADCLPIFLTNCDENFVSAIHAGWQGVANGVIINTIQAIKLEPSKMKAFIGPSISQANFQTGNELRDLFCDLDHSNEQFFIVDETTQNKYLCNIRGIAISQMLKLGLHIENITYSNICTYQNSDLFYSYRKEQVTGRFASLIWLDK